MNSAKRSSIFDVTCDIRIVFTRKQCSDYPEVRKKYSAAQK